MDKKTILTLFLSAVVLTVIAAKHTIVNSGFSFSPTELSINIGDEVTFSLESAHNVVEVNKTNWEANANTSNGGFSLGFGGGTIKFDSPGTYYYVCQPHASMGMKGKIIVSSTSSLQSSSLSQSTMSVSPNPATDQFKVSLTVPGSQWVHIYMTDILGTRTKQLVPLQKVVDTYTNSFETSGIRKGAYMIVAEIGNKQTIKKLVIK